MKTVLALALFALILTSCCAPCKKELFSGQINESDYDLNLKFNCADTLFQPIHLDMVSSFGILAKPKYNNVKKKFDVQFKIIEVGSCNRYYIDKVSNKRPRLTADSSIIFRIERIKSNSGRIKEVKNKEFSLTAGEIIDIRIESNDPEIVSPKDDNSSYTIYGERNARPNKKRTYFPPRICSSKVIINN